MFRGVILGLCRCSFPFLSFAGLESPGVVDLLVECFHPDLFGLRVFGFGDPTDLQAF